MEAVFGQLKSSNKFNRFTFKGLEKVELEFLLMALGHNFRKIAAKGAVSKKIVVKIAKQGSIIIFKIEIFVFVAQEFSSIEDDLQNFQSPKLAA